MAKDQDKKAAAQDKLELVQSADAVKQDKKDGKDAKKAQKKKKEKKKRGNPVKEMISELKKVTWPTRKEFINYSVCVFVFVAVMALIVWLMDSAPPSLSSCLPIRLRDCLRCSSKPGSSCK